MFKRKLWWSLGVGFVCVSGCAADVASEVDALGDKVSQRWFWLHQPTCPTYSCGFNSPFIGHEISLTGEPNSEGVALVGVSHPRHSGADVEFGVTGDELWATVNGALLEGDALLGLTLELEGDLDGVSVPFRVELLDVGTMQTWTGDGVSVPSYTWSYRAPGYHGPQLLCPANEFSESLAMNAFVADQVGLLEVRDFDQFEAQRAQAPMKGRGFEAVMYTGERFDFETGEVHQRDADEWFNWGCARSSGAKLHLMGHTHAADARLGQAETPRAYKQALLNALTARYCEGAPPMTVAGQPLRVADVRGLLPRDSPASFQPGDPGSVEALWSERGAVCLSVPRRLSAEPDIVDEIEAYCSIPRCEDPAALTQADANDVLLSDEVPVVSFNPAWPRWTTE